ncbi:MAG TPA: c-type cytochrome [Thermoanaerobaculia bacterium]|nr:c-type cytochrome [Thermoanaerobaculia bacterium]
MKRRTKLILGVTALLFIAAVFIFGSMIRHGFSAHDEPSRMEATMARAMRQWAVPSDLRDEKNPVPLTPAVLAEARAHFADHCATCHDNDGKGSDMGRKMYPRTPDLTLKPTQALSDGALFSIIENGVRLTGMPGFGSGTVESAFGSWTLVHFIRHLPKMTPEEMAEMRKLNPKSPAEWQQMQEEEAFLAREGEEPEAAPVAHEATLHHH